MIEKGIGKQINFLYLGRKHGAAVLACAISHHQHFFILQAPRGSQPAEREQDRCDMKELQEDEDTASIFSKSNQIKSNQIKSNQSLFIWRFSYRKKYLKVPHRNKQQQKNRNSKIKLGEDN